MDRGLVNMTAAPTAAMVPRTRLRPKVSARPWASSARSRRIRKRGDTTVLSASNPGPPPVAPARPQHWRSDPDMIVSAAGPRAARLTPALPGVN